jgi:hypothetical protein
VVDHQQAVDGERQQVKAMNVPKVEAAVMLALILPDHKA